MSEARQFIAIPRAVCASTAVDWPAKVVWAEVHSFTRQGRPCWLSVAELAARVHRSPRQVTAYLAELMELRWLVVTAQNGRRRQLAALVPQEASIHPRDPLPPTQPASTQPASTIEADRVADLKPTAWQPRDPLPTNKKQRRNREENEQHTDKARPKNADEVRAYFEELNAAHEAEGFHDYWTSAGWRRKSGPIRDWRAAARNWLRQPHRSGPAKARQLDPGRALSWADQ